MYRVGLTGNIASGKSTVARVWRDLGAHIIDADVLAREAVAPGSAGLDGVVAAFGEGVLAPDGSLDRGRLRGIVFGDDGARRRLESIVHPVVQRLRADAEAALVRRGVTMVVHEIPLLFETGLEDESDAIVFVDAPADERRRRLTELRGLGVAEAQAMIDAQMAAGPKRDRADHVVTNDGTLAELVERAAAIWRRLQEAAS